MPTQKYHSLTLVLPKPDPAVFERLQGLFSNSGENQSVLSPNKALDISVSDGHAGLGETVETVLRQNKIEADFCLQPSQSRKKKLLICDMDSTLIGQECIDELANFAGFGERVSAITERAMRGELDFDSALTQRVGLLEGLALEKLQTCYEQHISLNPGAKTLAHTMNANGAKTVIVSGGFTFFTARIAKLAGFQNHHANVLLDDGQNLTGKVEMPILGSDAKEKSLMAHSASIGGPNMAVAIGDGANDLAMIKASGLGIAYRAKPIVAEAAACAIKHTDLVSALYFQGFTDREIVFE